MVHVSNLSHYISGKKILDNINFSIPDNQVVGFLGPNGAGKTTTMRIITGYYPPMEGSVKVAGYDISEQSFKARTHLGYLPETVPLYDDLTVEEYLSFMASVMKVPAKTIKEHVASITRKTGLYDVRKRLINTISRGYKQRVGIAQALIGDPKVLILDEPTVGLDPVQIKEIRDLIKSLASSKTVILSTHILPEVSQICSRVIIINQGKIIADGSVDDLIHKQPGDLRVKVSFTGETDIKKILHSVKHVKSISDSRHQGNEYEVTIDLEQDVRADILKRLVSEHVKVVNFAGEVANLEDTFVRLVTKE